MVEGAPVVLAACFIDGVQIISQARAIGNQKTQRAYAVTGVDVACQADADGKKARPFKLSILPPLAQLRCERGIIRAAPLEFRRNVRVAPLMPVGLIVLVSAM